MGQYQFYSLLIQPTKTTGTQKFNLHKTNAVNKELVIRLGDGREGPSRIKIYTIVPSILTA